MKYKIFGCKVNKYYTDKWLGSDYLKDKNGVFIASCVVTDKAKKKWIKFVKNTIKSLQNNEKIFISGCGAFDKGDKTSNFFETYTELTSLQDKIEILPEDPGKNKLKKVQEKLKGIYTKKFVVIQGGCDSFCTFCLTVMKRGKHFSRSKEDILDEIQNFEKSGGKEIVITGINLGAWGLDNTNDLKSIPKLSELLEYILVNTKISRIKISSLGPEFIDDKLLEIFKNSRISPHFHLSIQSGSNKILRAMSRHYDQKHLRNLLYKIRNMNKEDNVDISIGADIIVGFPGETEEDFLDTLGLISDFQITKLHAFPFSAHKYSDSVPAGLFPNQIDDKIKKDRLNRLINLGDQVRQEFINSQIGKELEVLIESVRNGIFKGWTSNYIEISNENFEIIDGEIKKNCLIRGFLK